MCHVAVDSPVISLVLATPVSIVYLLVLHSVLKHIMWDPHYCLTSYSVAGSMHIASFEGVLEVKMYASRNQAAIKGPTCTDTCAHIEECRSRQIVRCM